MTYYKLTNEDGYTKNEMHWVVGVTNEATGDGTELCTDGYLHVYDTPEQAAFMRPAHVKTYTRLWEVESDDEGITNGTKRGVKRCTAIREIELPELTTEQRIEIGIRISLLVYKEKDYVRWAEGWLSGEDRSADAAYAAAYAADAADAAADAAYAATCATYAADAADAADAAADAADDAAAYAAGKIDLISIINQVLGKSANK